MIRLFSRRYLTIEALLGRGGEKEWEREWTRGDMKRKNESHRSPWTIEALSGREGGGGGGGGEEGEVRNSGSCMEQN